MECPQMQSTEKFFSTLLLHTLAPTHYGFERLVKYFNVELLKIKQKPL